MKTEHFNYLDIGQEIKFAKNNREQTGRMSLTQAAWGYSRLNDRGTQATVLKIQQLDFHSIQMPKAAMNVSNDLGENMNSLEELWGSISLLIGKTWAKIYRLF